jgi:UDP-glucose-4-epimerase GalE
MRVLVTGGAGYVGSHCVRRLVAAGHEAVVFDNLVQGHRAAVDPGARLIEGDLADGALVGRTLGDGGFDAVMHFAAHLDVAESVREPLKYYENNVVNTIRLLQAMREAGVKKMIFSSTCATFGTPERMPITEDLPQDPINPYGRTKLAMEWALGDSAEAWGLGSTSLRYFNASGAAVDGTIGEDHDPEPHLIPLILKVALGQRDEIKIFGTDYPTPDGTCVRDYIHVADLAEVHLLALGAVQPGEAKCFNVGTGVGTSVREVIDAARRVTGHEIPAVEEGRRPGDPPELYADPSKVKQAFDWEPKYVHIEALVETAWKWHSTHPNGYGD